MSIARNDCPEIPTRQLFLIPSGAAWRWDMLTTHSTQIRNTLLNGVRTHEAHVKDLFLVLPDLLPHFR